MWRMLNPGGHFLERLFMVKLVSMKDEQGEEEVVLLETGGDDYNPFLNARDFEIHRTSTAPEVAKAIDSLCSEFGKFTDKFKTHLRVLVCDLYHNYKGNKERYLNVGLSKELGKFKLIRRYNRFEIGYRLLKESVDFLRGGDYIEYKQGYRREGFANGFQTRIRATEKLIVFLELEHHVTEQMVHIYQSQELIIRKQKPIKKKITTKNRQGKAINLNVKIKLLDEYNDTNHTKRWRNTLERYNALLDSTYLDIDLASYLPSKKRKRPLFIDLSRKRVRRIFSNGNFTSGGRFYGGWWQGTPSDMRPYILINGRHVVEHDFSGMHIHILYALKGKRLSDLGLLPYKVSKDDDPERKRPYYKKLLLAAVNADSKSGCISAIKKDIKKNPEDYPEGDYDLRDLLEEIISYHPEINEFLCSDKGLYSQYVDSCIAYRVIKEMTDKNIPVLCIHDSFIGSDNHADDLLHCMKRAYVEELNLLLRNRDHKLKLSIEDSLTDETTILQRNHQSAAHMIRFASNLMFLDLLRMKSLRISTSDSKKPFYKTINREKAEHLFRIELKIDAKQKSRQLAWLSSNKSKYNFNETIVVSS